MAGFLSRLLGVAVAEDEAVNAAFGGSSRETISGTVGRAALAGQWWAKAIAQPLINTLVGNPQHCQAQAAIEAKRREEEQA